MAGHYTIPITIPSLSHMVDISSGDTLNPYRIPIFVATQFTIDIHYDPLIVHVALLFAGKICWCGWFRNPAPGWSRWMVQSLEVNKKNLPTGAGVAATFHRFPSFRS